MEVGKMPPGKVHDIKYLYTVINALKYKGKKMEDNVKTLEYLKKAINQYNEAKATKYGLSFRPKEVNVRVINYILDELKILDKL